MKFAKAGTGISRKGRRHHRRSGLRLALSSLMLVSLAVFSDVSPSSANFLPMSQSTFEGADGDQVVTTAGRTDWESALTASAGGISPNLFRLNDLVSGTTDDSLAGGVKDDTECPASTTGSIPKNKDDLERMYLYHETITSASVTNTFLYLGYVRALPSGTTASAHGVFELNQLNTKCPDFVKGANVTPSKFYVRTPGDVRVAFDDAGGDSPVVSYQLWQEPCLAGGVGCWSGKTTLNSSQAEGDFNDAIITDRLHNDVLLGEQRFSEVKINMNAAGLLAAGSCTGFGAAGLFTGSSGNSDNEQSKDFIAPQPINLNFCQPATISINKVDGNGNPLAGATIGLFNDEAPPSASHGVYAAGDTLATVVSGTGFSANPCVTTATGTCVWKVSGSGTKHYVVRETAAPTGYQLNTTAVHVDVTFGPNTQNFPLGNLENLPAPRDLVIQKNDDDSPANPVSGVVFRVIEDFLTDNVFGAAEQTAYASGSVRTCTTGVTGQCTITSLDPGKFYWVVEHSKPAGYGEDAGASNCTVSTGPDVVKKCRRIEVPIGTGSVGPTGATFTNPRLFKVVTFVCIKTNNTLYAAEATYDNTALSGTNNTATGGNPAGITSDVQTGICGMTGGSVHDNVTYGEHSPNKANIPR